MKKNRKKTPVTLFKNKTFQKVLLFSGGAIVLGILAFTIINMPSLRTGSQEGVGADGYSVKVLKGKDMKISEVVKKPLVEKYLSTGIAGQIGNVNKTDVLDMNGNFGQTATYYFKAKGTDVVCNFYTDVMVYKSKAAYDSDDVFIGTGDAGKVGDLDARYMPAATIGKDREYALLVTNGLKSYKFAIVQPAKSIQIDEKTAQDALKKIATEANLDIVSR
ncbi:MAG: hypothetical protein EOO17_04935 [Chloroflexi bacterium]|nr:MAG: hypothetical protein EOO17_04935 [Chloroflexota bacterium]